MLKSRETPLNAERNPLQCNDVCEHGISHDIASHQSPPFIVSRNGGADEEGQIIWPGQKLVLLPPSFHNKTYVESQDERHGYGFAVVEVITNFFENLSLVLIQNVSICKIDEVVEE